MSQLKSINPQPIDTTLATLATTGWPFQPGQRVRVKLGEGWRRDWQDVILVVTGVRLDRYGFVRISASDDFPHRDGQDDFVVEDLELVV